MSATEFATPLSQNHVTPREEQGEVTGKRPTLIFQITNRESERKIMLVSLKISLFQACENLSLTHSLTISLSLSLSLFLFLFLFLLNLSLSALRMHIGRASV
jgi:hypothetical protein